MPPMAAKPVAIPKDKERELDQEFELDIRVTWFTALPSAIIPTRTCGTDCGTCQTNCGTCATCRSCPTPATGGCCPHT